MMILKKISIRLDFFIFFLILIFPFYYLYITHGEEKRDHMQTIKISELMTQVIIIGELGYPLGEIITIKGYSYEPDPRTHKDPTRRFRVTYVNGKNINPPIDFKIGDLQPVDSVKFVDLSEHQFWEIKGYESGRFRDLPNGVLKELKYAITQEYGFRFVPEFHYIVVKKIDPDQNCN